MVLLAVIYLSFISLGLPDSLLGSAWPVMQPMFGVPISSMGIVTMIISGATILSSLFAAQLTARFGTGKVTLISVFLTAVALFGFSTASQFWTLCVWAVPYGLGAGAIDAALNNYVALHFTSRHMSWLHCFWGVGTIISPYIMSYALRHTRWQDGYRTVSLIQAGIVAVLLLTLSLWKKDKGAEEFVTALRLKDVLKIRGVPTLLTGFFCYCAAESTVMLWASSYLVHVRGVSEERAAAFASLFFIGITAGRFLAGFVSEKLGDRNLIRLGTCIIAVGIVCVLLPLKTDFFALAGFVVIGFGCAPIYPSIIHATPSNFGEKYSQSIIGIQMASAYVGSTLMPPLFGLLAQYVDMRLLPIYLAVFFTAMIFLVEKTFRTVKEH